MFQSKFKVLAATVIFSGVLIHEYQKKNAGTMELASQTVPRTVKMTSPGISSPAVIRPKNKMGFLDTHAHGAGPEIQPDTPEGQRRIKTLGSFTGIRTFNFWWIGFEHSDYPKSSLTPNLACPAGSGMFPRNEKMKQEYGFKKYRCIEIATVEKFGKQLKMDEEQGIQTSLTLYFPPDQYIDEACLKAPDKDRFRGGCPPRYDAMDDFEDYMRVMGYFYGGLSHGESFGKIEHWVVSNEVASRFWFNLPTNERTDAGRVNRYAEMFRRAHDALKGVGVTGVMMYISTDLHWELPGPEGHMGSQKFVELFRNHRLIGTDIDWSIAVHPYTDHEALSPKTFPPAAQHGVYGFGSLDKVVEYQLKWLRSKGVPESQLASSPQAFLYASEQGWDMCKATNPNVALELCIAHDIVEKNPFVIGSAYNTLQDQPQDTCSKAVQNTLFGLIPSDAGDLKNLQAKPIGQALLSTNPELWNKSNNHFCCQYAERGCASEPKK